MVVIRCATAENLQTVSSEFGRISNLPEDQIHVASANNLNDCVRRCVDFSKSFPQYYQEDCYAYNYDDDNHSCELIHSPSPILYQISNNPRWITGLKY